MRDYSKYSLKELVTAKKANQKLSLLLGCFCIVAFCIKIFFAYTNNFLVALGLIFMFACIKAVFHSVVLGKKIKQKQEMENALQQRVKFDHPDPFQDVFDAFPDSAVMEAYRIYKNLGGWATSYEAFEEVFEKFPDRTLAQKKRLYNYIQYMASK